MMDDRNFEIALETFLTNVGVDIEGDIDEKIRTVEANGELALEFAYYLFRALTVLETELTSSDEGIIQIKKFLDRHLRTGL